MREPPFWWLPQRGPGTALLAPFAALYGAVAAHRLSRTGRRVGAPVVCVGNPTVGGSGKTPLVIAIARMLMAEGKRPALLTRGYGGRLPGPLHVDPLRHRAAEVGDEALLLARVAPTIVARDRIKGAGAALATGGRADVIVMDDGFQNPSLAKDFSVLVIDARRGIGNARVLPAGPLRAPLGAQLARAQALVVVGAGSGADAATVEARKRDIPIFAARLEPDAAVVAALAPHRALAFAGIGDPEKFFATLREAAIALADTRSFPDHHCYTRSEAQTLCRDADRAGLNLVTTEKDLARMQGEEASVELAARAHALPITLVLEDPVGFKRLLFEQLR